MESDEEYEVEIDEKEHAFSILESFGIMREKEEHSYFTIKVGNKELRVNRDLMIAASGYISAIFTHDTVEKKTGVLNMKDVEFVLVKKCVDFVYTGKISISLSRCENLLYVACLMQLWTLREHIGRFLKDHLSVSSLFRMWNLVLKFNIENLNKSCCQFAYENLEMVASEKEFVDLDADVISLFLSVRKSSSCGGEDHKVIEILRWVKHDEESRRQYLGELLKCVDLKNVSPRYSRSLVESEPIIYQSPECTRMFCIATMDNHSVKRQKLDPNYHRVPNTLIVFDTQSKALQAYRPDAKTLTEISELRPNMANANFVAVSIRNHVYVLMENKKVYRLNVFEGELGWVEMHEMRNCHQSASSAMLNGYIYIAGGNSMERYSLRDDEWQEIASYGISFEKFTLVAHLDEVYNIGDSTASAHKYSPDLGVWSRFAPLPQNRSGEYLFGVSLADKIYALSKHPHYSSTYCIFYNKTSNAWTEVAPCNLNRTAKLCICSNEMFVVTDMLNIYQIAENQWRQHGSTQRNILPRATVSIWLPEQA